LQSLPGDGCGLTRREKVEGTHAALRVKSLLSKDRSRKDLRSLGTLIGTVSPERRRTVSA
jgi:hypothetical protein